MDAQGECRRRRVRFAGVLIGLGLVGGTLAAGEDPGQLFAGYQTQTLSPVQVGTAIGSEAQRSDSPWCTGQAPSAPDRGEWAPVRGTAVVGYSATVDLGTWPFGCPEWRVHTYTGAVRFDLAAIPRGAVNRALVGMLSFRREAPPLPEAGAGCAISIERVATATAPWTVRYDFADLPSRPAPLWCTVTDDGNRYECNVSAVLQRWLEAAQSNHGFALLPVAHTLPRRAEFGEGAIYSERPRCLHRYRDFRLRVYYTETPPS